MTDDILDALRETHLDPKHGTMSACGAKARDLSERLKTLDYRAWRVPIAGHIVTRVQVEGRYWHLDPCYATYWRQTKTRPSSISI